MDINTYIRLEEGYYTKRKYLMTTQTEEPEKPDIGRSTSYFDEDTLRFFKQTVERHKDVSTHIIPAKLARKTLTEKRIEIIETIREEEIESKRDLARKVDRDISVVSKDLKTLWKYGVIEYGEGKNRRKIPELSADKIIVEPL
ncbi:MAG: hypothetical protein ABEJ03_05235 [Candidatus Nanohaloarchaea archaeon]